MPRSIPRIFARLSIVSCAILASSCSTLRSNLQTVDPGQFYRSGQMNGHELDAVADWIGIKTVVNLRGAHPEEAWYRDEIRVCDRNRIVHRDLAWTMRQIPTPESLNQLIGWIRTEPRPILVHCQGGVHRAAVASAVYRLLRGDRVEEAREEFGLFFNDAPIGELLDLYDPSKPFDEWARDDYPALYAARVTP